VVFEPLPGHRTVLLHARGSTAEVAGHCGICGAVHGQTFAPVSYAVSDGDRRTVVLGVPVACSCGFPVVWVVDRRLVRRVGRHWRKLAA
jgi:hypothetical protein